jgi:hypothetical protein
MLFPPLGELAEGGFAPPATSTTELNRRKRSGLQGLNRGNEN